MKKTVIILLALITCTPRLTAKEQISLITCYPGRELYSLYGHSAIRYTDDERGLDMVVNYGLFDASGASFVMDFALGKLYYHVGVQDFEDFLASYRREGRKVIEQRLNLSPEQIQKALGKINNDLLPENSTYLYNIFYKNCTTQARDVILEAIDKTPPTPDSPDNLTYRKLIDPYTAHDKWLQLGINLALGMGADRKLNASETQILPLTLMKWLPDYLVSDTVVLHESHTQHLEAAETTSTPPTSPLTAAAAILTLALTSLFVRNNHLAVRIFDAILIIVVFTGGVTLTLLAVSKHPTTTANFVMLAINPLPALLLYRRLSGKKNVAKGYTVWAISITLCLLANVAQTYPLPFNIFAAALLLRCIGNIRKPNFT